MTTWTVDGTEFCPVSETRPPLPGGGQAHTLDILSPPYTTHSLTPEQVNARFESSLSEDIDMRSGAPSISSGDEEFQPFVGVQ